MKTLQTVDNRFLLLRLLRLLRVVFDEDVLLVFEEAVEKQQPVLANLTGKSHRLLDLHNSEVCSPELGFHRILLGCVSQE